VQTWKGGWGAGSLPNGKLKEKGRAKNGVLTGKGGLREKTLGVVRGQIPFTLIPAVSKGKRELGGEKGEGTGLLKGGTGKGEAKWKSRMWFGPIHRCAP